MLVVKNLTLEVQGHTLHRNLNLKCLPGQLVAILGPNGIGKSTLLNALSGVQHVTQGHIFLDEQEIHQIHPANRASQISSIPQYDETDLHTLVYDRIAHGLFARSITDDLSSKDEHELILHVAHRVGVQHVLDNPLFALSGGLRKKVHIARALVNNHSKAFLLDEPDASLDAPSRLDIMSLLERLASLEKKIVVVSLHHQELANQFAHVQFSF